MKVITNKYLEIRTLDFGSFVYNITTAPVHGWISVLAPNKVGKEKIQLNFNFKSEIKTIIMGATLDQQRAKQYTVLVSGV